MKINRNNLIIFLVLLAIEMFIAIYVHDDFIRPFIGDLLVVILMYFFVKIIYSGNNLKLIIGIFAFAVCIEFLQYLNLIDFLHIKNKILKIILGSVFDWKDIFAYGAGCSILALKEVIGKR